MTSCQADRGSWEVTIVDRRPYLLLDDFEQVVTGAGVKRLEAEVVEDQEIGAAEGFDEARMAPIASGERQILAELRPAMIEDGAIVAAGFLADGASQPALADAGWADEGQIVVGVDPVALGELLEQGAIQTTGGAIVDVLDARLLVQPGGAGARSGVCPSATRLPCRGAGRASRHAECPSPGRPRRDRRRPWPFHRDRGCEAGRGLDV